MTRIVILGTGNIARHWFDAFSAYDNLKVVRVLGRNEKALAHFGPVAQIRTADRSMPDADLYIIAVSDDAITTVAEWIDQKNKLIVHCSGSLAMLALPSQNRRGVFYPVQTFSKGRQVDLREVPVCIEAENEQDLKFLQKLASRLSDKVFEVSSAQRQHIHLAAVFVNNFTNYLYGIGEEICAENGVPFSILHPLIRETASKISEISSKKAQTGPARRLDKGIIAKHLKLLKHTGYQDIYSVLSNSIEQTYSKGSGSRSHGGKGD